MINETVYLIIIATFLEELTFGFFIRKRGRNLIDWIIKHYTWQDQLVWFNPLIFFVSHILVYGFTIDNILMSGSFAFQLHIISQLIVLHNAKRNYERNVLPKIRKRIKEHTIVVSKPHYSKLEWMLCNQ